ncbi:MAG: site-2 protease family protein [Rickettsiaceae bacterium]
MLEYLEIIENIVILIFSLVIHENAHARVAYYLGDPTARNVGRFSLNPLKHIEWSGLLLPFILSFMKLPPVGFAKPVPVCIQNFKHPTLYNILVALAGPASNLLLAFIAIILYNRLSFLPQTTFIVVNTFLVNFCIINLLLCIFNAIPIPPLDGSRIYTSFIDHRKIKIHICLEYIGFATIILLLGNKQFTQYFNSLLIYLISIMEYFSG